MVDPPGPPDPTRKQGLTEIDPDGASDVDIPRIDMAALGEVAAAHPEVDGIDAMPGAKLAERLVPLWRELLARGVVAPPSDVSSVSVDLTPDGAGVRITFHDEPGHLGMPMTNHLTLMITETGGLSVMRDEAAKLWHYLTYREADPGDPTRKQG